MPSRKIWLEHQHCSLPKTKMGGGAMKKRRKINKAVWLETEYFRKVDSKHSMNNV